MSVAFQEVNKVSVANEFMPILKVAVAEARRADKLEGLVALLEATLSEIKKTSTKKRAIDL